MSEELAEFIEKTLKGINNKDLSPIINNLMPSINGTIQEAVLIGKLLAYKPIADKECMKSVSCRECHLKHQHRCYYYYLWTKYDKPD